MLVKDISVTVEKLDEVRGGASISQYIENGATTGFSVALGGGVNSPTSSTSTVLSGHTNSQDASALDVRERITAYSVLNSQNVAIGSFSPYRRRFVL